MDRALPRASSAPSPEALIDRIQRHLADDQERGRQGPVPVREIERAATAAVNALWGSRVKTFIEVIALRQARDMLMAPSGGLVTAESSPIAPRVEPVTIPPTREAGGFFLEQRDVLVLSDDGAAV